MNLNLLSCYCYLYCYAMTLVPTLKGFIVLLTSCLQNPHGQSNNKVIHTRDRHTSVKPASITVTTW